MSSRVHASVTAAASAALLAGLAVSGARHASYLAAHPLIFPWIGLSLLLGFGLFFLNGSGIALRGTVLAHLGYGAIAALLGFALQSAINGPMARHLGAAEIASYGGALLLGLGSALAQTAGKLALAAVFLREASRTPKESLAIGLAIGLGFGLTEAILISIQTIVAQVPLTSLAGAFERGVAEGFHLYSGGLIAVAFLLRKFWLIGIVALLHAALDTASVALAPRVPMLVLEGLFLIPAVAAWLIYRRFSGGLDGLGLIPGRK